jgi:hypothetical protein
MKDDDNMNDLAAIRNAMGRASAKKRILGDLGRAAEILSDRFPELRLNLLTGIIDGNVSIAEARIYLESETVARLSATSLPTRWK